MQKNLLEDCQICTITYNILSSEFVLLKCGHEVCRKCFSDPRMRFCPNCRKEKKEYKTKFDELSEKHKAQKKKNKKCKMRNENIMIEYESLKYVLRTLTPKAIIKKLVQREIQKYEARIEGQRKLPFVVQKLQTFSKAIWKTWFGKKTNSLGRSFIKTFKLDSIDCDDSLGTVQLWIQLRGTPSDDLETYAYVVILKLVVLKFILYHAARKFLKYVPKNESNYSFQDPILNALFLSYEFWKTPELWANILFGFALFQQTKLSLMHNLGCLGVIITIHFEGFWDLVKTYEGRVHPFILYAWAICGTSFCLKEVDKRGFMYICKYFLLAVEVVYFLSIIFDVFFLLNIVDGSNWFNSMEIVRNI